MSWIRTVQPAEAEGRLARIYQSVAGKDGEVDNVLLVHSLRPHTLEGHLALYRSVLHHAGNRLDPALAEAIGVLVSRLNGCRYCVVHHARGLRRALGDEALGEAWLRALESGSSKEVFEPRQRAALIYAEGLTRRPGSVDSEDIDALRAAGWQDGEILEINQVVAYFAYANRCVLGLGVTLEG